MMIHLMNSAMMPVPGRYTLRSVSESEFAAFMKGKEFVSYIGYPQNAEYLSALIGAHVPVARGEILSLEPGDILAIQKLAYRVQNPATKGQSVDPADYRYYLAEYEGSE